MPVKKLAVVLGAGASFDSWNGRTQRSKEWQPPLAKDLFDFSRKEFSDIARQYHDSWSLMDQLAGQSTVAGFDVEAKLRKLADVRDTRYTRQFNGIPCYIRDVIHAVDTYYIESPNCYGQLVNAVLTEYPHYVAFISLNYDTLLEKAIARFDPSQAISEFEHYADQHRDAMVIKLHGSINWFVRLRESFREMSASHIFRPLIDATGDRVHLNDVRFVDGIIHADSAPPGWNHLYPILTAPLAGKGVKDLVCPREHTDALEGFLWDCEKLLVIGSSGKDEDLLELLGRSMVNLRAYQFVGGDDVEEVQDRFVSRIRWDRPRSPFDPCSSGFRVYVNNEIFEPFLKA